MGSAVEDVVAGWSGGGPECWGDLGQDGLVEGGGLEDEGEHPEGKFVTIGVGPSSRKMSRFSGCGHASRSCLHSLLR